MVQTRLSIVKNFRTANSYTYVYTLHSTHMVKRCYILNEPRRESEMHPVFIYYTMAKLGGALSCISRLVRFDFPAEPLALFKSQKKRNHEKKKDMWHRRPILYKYIRVHCVARSTRSINHFSIFRRSPRLVR